MSSVENDRSLEGVRKADEYLRKHHILELMNDLCAATCFHKPVDVRSFLLEELQAREREGAERGFFEDRDVDAVFSLADLMETGIISDDQCRAALMSLANSQKQRDEVDLIELPEEIDRRIFEEKAKELLKL
mmetsp:Transcript_51108/g.136391  ORF Transcript_51108/g.136391 Transcript_51108/m.136391 type:complete len:132 (-) Transcript_51108:92-487(-)|eukprot:CAMPEP_0194502512 /NCGR_PEP_ID=MMETSP0253-20130528/25988_1 /TAXON_ID=2966 /ORGANISM="Noctiluca scintillans" /LENGTH=131 /DNA_ID=CAMNT_0039344673 /DNA_START=43 /DNA_END=438 /DNA_ORIENTATION=+